MAEIALDAILTGLTVVSLTQVDAGKATRYAPGRMDQVIANRVKWQQLDPSTFGRYRGFVALQDCRHRGKVAWLRLDDGRIVGPYLVADCGAKHDQAWLDKINFAVDLSHELAEELGLPQSEVTVYVETGRVVYGDGAAVALVVADG